MCTVVAVTTVHQDSLHLLSYLKTKISSEDSPGEVDLHDLYEILRLQSPWVAK